MSTLKLNIPHSLPKEEAITRIKNMLSNLKEEQKDNFTNLSEQWDNDTGSFSLSARGFDLGGNIKVHDDQVEIESKLPFAVSFFKSQIADLITKEATKLLR